MGEVTRLLIAIQEKIAAALIKCNRANNSCRLVAVSKFKPNEAIQEAFDAQHRHFGENYVAELLTKSSELPTDIKWHYIGALQSNKVKKLTSVPNLYLWETCETTKMATAVDQALSKSIIERTHGPKLKVLIQVNTSLEDSKSGVTTNEEVLQLAKHIIDNCSRLQFSGLMTIGGKWKQSNPDDPQDVNPDFVKLFQLRKFLSESLALEASQLELSMGMSDDFEHAIRLGSTNVRVGSSIFGSR